MSTSRSSRANARCINSIIRNDVEGVRSALRESPDLKLRDREHSETGLILAVQFAHRDIIDLLLRNGDEVDANDDSGRTALSYAFTARVKFADVEQVVSLLLDHGANVNAADNEGHSILMHAVRAASKPKVVADLLNRGADRAATNAGNETALSIAVDYGFLELAKLL